MRNSTKWIISFVHALILFAFSFWWINSNLTYGDERFLIQWSSIFKRVILKIDNPPEPNEFIFINLAYEKELIPRLDGTGKEVITDRKKLAELFSIIKRNQDKISYTLCDVLLEGESENDSILQKSVAGIKKIIFPVSLNNKGVREKLSVDVPSSIAEYEIAKEGFLKFKLVTSNQEKSLPVIMYEQIGNKKLRKQYGIPFDGNNPMFKSLIIDFFIRPYSFLQEGKYPVIPLSDLLLLPEEVIVNEFLRDRMIILGDFEHDIHETVFGSSPGTLILLNVYLNLKSGRHLISIWWFIFIVIGFTFFSKKSIFPDQQENNNHNGWWISLLQKVVFLTLLSATSYLIFNVHIQVLILSLYLNALSFILRFKKTEFHWKNIKDWFFQLREIFFNFK